MMNGRQLWLVLLLLSLPCGVWGQSERVKITLQEAIVRASKESVESKMVRNEYIASYWEYRTYRSELLPEVTLSGTVPYYSKSYNAYQEQDGSYKYVSNDYSQIDVGLSVTQNIPFTGGKISLESTTQRLKQYGRNSSTRYKNIPIALTYEQPIFGFNRVGWLHKIEPIKKLEADQKLIADVEEISLRVVGYYFDLLLGEVNLEIAQQNLENSQKVYSIAQARRKMGQISENELLQLKVTQLNSEAELTDAVASLDARMFQLRSFLGFDQRVVLEPVLPIGVELTLPHLDYSEVVGRATENNALTHNIERQLLEASREVSRAKSDRWNFTLFASFGYSAQEERLRQTFHSANMRSNQIVEVGIRLPILDWGKRKGGVKVAQANREVVEARMEREQMNFEQNIFLAVQRFNNQSQQLLIAQEADKVAQQRYETSVEAFVLGKIDVLNLNDAQASKDLARRNYIEQLYDLWYYHYQIRNLTLYDFVNDQPLGVNYDDYLN